MARRKPVSKPVAELDDGIARSYALAYDITLASVARITVTATSVAEAKRIASLAMRSALDSAHLDVALQCDLRQTVTLTEASAYMDSERGPRLFEINERMIDVEPAGKPGDRLLTTGATE